MSYSPAEKRTEAICPRQPRRLAEDLALSTAALQLIMCLFPIELRAPLPRKCIYSSKCHILQNLGGWGEWKGFGSPSNVPFQAATSAGKCYANAVLI